MRWNIDVEDFGDHLRPSMQEIGPPVHDLQPTLPRLSARLLQEDEIAPIIQIPGDAAIRKAGRVRQWRTRRVLAEARCVDDKRARLQTGKHGVVGAMLRRQHVFDRRARAKLVMDAPQFVESRLAAVRDERFAMGDRRRDASCMRCHVSAMVEPPAPMEKTSAPERSKYRSGRKPSSANPEEIGSFAWHISRPSRLERQLVSPIKRA